MNKTLRNALLSGFVLSVLIISCKQKSDKAELSVSAAPETNTSILNTDEEEIKATVENLLFAAGNYNIKDLDDMTSDKGMLGISSLKDGVWSNSEITINEFFASVDEREPSPYSEIPNKYDIIVTESQMALVRADCILFKYGIPQTKEINHFTLMRENNKWLILNISWTREKVTEDKKKFDLDIFAHSYAQAWCSTRPNFVASYFASDGVLLVNDGKPAKGTKAIINVAKSFMETFPDMVVAMDSLITKLDETRLYWTLTGTNDVPNGTGNKVQISGFEEWTLNEDGLIQESKGHFDKEEYKQQLEFGIKK